MTLGGSTFVYRGIDQDYCFIETLDCLYELCDQVSVAVGGEDGTPEKVFEWARTKKKGKVLITYISPGEWASQVGREKLSYFSNLAIAKLETKFQFYLQADEIIHEDSFEHIRAAIQHDFDSLFVRRLNLWRDPLHMLNVPQDRKPCSTEVVRLARTCYRAYDDAESLATQEVHIYGELDLIQIYHMGFVRDRVKHLEKIRHMQTEVFLWGDYDVKAKDCQEFQPDRWFGDADLLPIPRPLPKFIQAWAKQRYPGLFPEPLDNK